ncbi:MAG: TonB-dependent receptor [Wenzhouxiangella sp.]|nr:MAG: TonB-dependent receptor [Wenzhouxiangella sp.]
MKRNTLSLMIASLLLASPALYGEDADTDETEATTIDRIVVTGTRAVGRTALQSVAPVDLLTAEDLENHGSTEINNILSYALPSFNFPQPQISDGTDSIRPAQLRGLGPDQTLVLVNNRRRHSSALLNRNTVGRGSAAVDLNTIPVGAIGSVEVLRDGAAAQYGSDAIAGVINVRLREAREGGAVTVTYGEHISSLDLPRSSRNVRDGETVTVSAWTGLPLGNDGFLTLAGEFRDRSVTNRADLDTVIQFPLIDGELDPREAQADRLQWRFGNPEVQDISFMANAGLPLDGTTELYGFASYQQRDATSFGFYRRPRQTTQNVPEIYPFGFLPQINPEITDYSLAIGARGDFGAWDWDTSVVHGRNNVDYTIRNSLNASLGPASPTVFDAGELEYEQTVVNADIVRAFPVDAFSGDLNVAMGAEFRNERFRIREGEEASYRNFGQGVPGAAAGSQVFPGYSPATATNESRDAWSLWVDLEADVTDQLILSAAARFEDYSDFGSTFNAKLGGRFQLTDDLAIRGSASTGFRAPSLHQSFYTNTSTVFIDNVPFETGLFAVDSETARILGSQPLEPEESINYTLGLVFARGGFSVTVDAYRIEIDDRVLLTENLTAGNTPQLPELIGPGRAARFFINGADSVTTGVDVVTSYDWDTDWGRFSAMAAANWNTTELKNIRGTGVLSELDPPPTLFGQQNIIRQEEGAPRNKFIYSLDWSRDQLSATARATRFGQVSVPAVNPNLNYWLSPQWVVDLEGTVRLSERLSFSLGANNLLDSYPDENPFFNVNPGFGTNAPFVYSQFAPAGFNGRYVYMRGRYTW